jgi:CubicO group peptidase (beta-lactamase class C family)
LTCELKGSKKVWVVAKSSSKSKTTSKTLGAKIFGPGAEKWLDMAFATQFREAQCLLVMKNGSVIGEWNFDKHTSETNIESASVTKSFAATLIGIAVKKGQIKLDDLATKFIPEWIGTQSANITIRHILAMTTGRKEWTPADIKNPQIGEVLNVGQLELGFDQFLKVKRFTQPGNRWAYRSGDSQVLAYILTRATGESVQAFAQRELFEPLGQTIDVTLTSSGVAGLFAGFRLGCDDLAKLVQLYLNRGKWDGRQIIDESFVVDALTSQVTCGACAKTGFDQSVMNGAYGLHWWLNAATPTACNAIDISQCMSLSTNPGPSFRNLPTNMFYAAGACNQLGVGLPSEQLVVVLLHKGCDDPAQAALSAGNTRASAFFEEMARALK